MKFTFRNAFYLLPLLLFLKSHHAQETFHLNQALTQAISHNKELAFARLEIDRAKARFRWSGRLPNPRLELNGSSDHFGLNEGERNLQIAFVQSYPRTAALHSETTLRYHQIALAEAEIRTKEQALAARVAESLLQLVATEHFLEITREHIELDKAILRSLKDFINRGEASRLDLAQTELKLRHLHQQERGQITKIKQYRLQLHQLLGLPPEPEVFFRYDMNLPEAKPSSPLSEEKILSNRAEYRLAEGEIRAADSALAHERANTRGAINWKAILQEERSIDQPEGAERNTFIGVGVSIPLPLRQKNEAGIELATINKRSAEKALEALRFNILSEYHAAHSYHTDNWAIARTADTEILQLARKSYDDYRLAYLDGQVSLLQVQRALEQLNELEEQALKATVLYHQSQIQLRRLSGELLPPAEQ